MTAPMLVRYQQNGYRFFIIAYHPMTTPVLVYQRFSEFGLDYARSAAVLLALFCVTIFVLLRLFSRRVETQGVRDA